MKNNKGFTLVEILTVVALLGILMGLAIAGYTRYIDISKNKSYNYMAESAMNAAEEYAMEYPALTEVTFEELVRLQFLSPTIDPSDKTKECTGKVTIEVKKDQHKLDVNHYTVVLCCANTYKTYKFPENTVTNNDTCQVNI